MKIRWNMRSEDNQVFSKIMEDTEEPPRSEFQLAEGDFIVTARKEYFVESFSITLFPAERHDGSGRNQGDKGRYFLIISNNLDGKDIICSANSYGIDESIKMVKYISTFKMENAVNYFKKNKW